MNSYGRQSVKIAKTYEYLHHKLPMTSGYSPISRLSNELLSEIFLHLRPDSEERWNGAVSVQGSYYRLEGNGSSDSTALLTILRVCSHWRQVAQSFSGLWSDLRIIDNDPTLLDFMLQFAKNVTIDLPKLIISIDGRNGKLVRDHLAHTRELYLQFYSDDFGEDGVRSSLEEMAERVLASDATSVLEILRLKNVGQYFWDPSSTPTITALDIPPRLKSLSLQDICVSMRQGFQTTSITSFSVNPAPPPWKCTESDGLFDVLTCMPNLSCLTLDYGCYTPRVRSSPRSPLVDLPHLRDLTFICSPAYYLYMCPSLSVPMSTTRKIHFTDFTIFDKYDIPPGTFLQLSYEKPTRQLLDTCLNKFHNNLANSFTQWASVNLTSVCQVAYSVKGHGRHGEVTVKAKVTARASSRNNLIDSTQLPASTPAEIPNSSSASKFTMGTVESTKYWSALFPSFPPSQTCFLRISLIHSTSRLISPLRPPTGLSLIGSLASSTGQFASHRRRWCQRLVRTSSQTPEEAGHNTVHVCLP